MASRLDRVMGLVCRHHEAWGLLGLSVGMGRKGVVRSSFDRSLQGAPKHHIRFSPAHRWTSQFNP